MHNDNATQSFLISLKWWNFVFVISWNLSVPIHIFITYNIHTSIQNKTEIFYTLGKIQYSERIHLNMIEKRQAQSESMWIKGKNWH